MEIKEKTIKELDNLNTGKLLALYDIIISWKTGKMKVKEVAGSKAYLKVREILKNINGNLSEDVILMRKDRV